MALQAIRYSPAKDSSEASLQILDQLALPHRSTYVGIHTCEDAHAAIKQMRVRGAPAIAIVAALALAVQLDHELKHDLLPSKAEEVVQLINHRLEYLVTSRPTAVNLADAVGKLKIVSRKAGQVPEANTKHVVDQYVNTAEDMLVQDVKDNEAIGEYGAKWIIDRRKGRPDSLQVLTHCNTGSLATAGGGTALGVIRALHASKHLKRAYCTETRPYNQGSRLTAYELVHDQIPATLITDSMAAAMMAQEKDDMAAVIVGADRVAANGDTANKIGTYSLAILARYHGVKFLVAAPRTTIDLSTKTGKEIVIEERAAEEVTRIRGPRVGPDGQIVTNEDAVLISTAAIGVDVWNPAFDVTPADLIDGIVTEVGVVEKDSKGKLDLSSVFGHGIRNGTCSP